MSTHNQSRSMTALSENVRLMRQRKSITQADLAAAIGVSHPRISEIESGRANPTLATIDAIATFFGITASELLTEQKAKKLAKVG